MRVIREWEESYSEYNSQTQRYERKIRRGSDIMSENTQMTPFWVRDQTGQILVNPAGAEIEGVQVIDQFQPQGPEMQEGTISLGSFTFHYSTPNMAGDRQTLGYRFHELILPLERNVYVLGVASDSSGELTIQKPRARGQRFIISLKSEGELLASGQSTMKWLQIGAIVCVVLGLILLIATLVV
jgi:E3 Ubiquitin ligase